MSKARDERRFKMAAFGAEQILGLFNAVRRDHQMLTLPRIKDLPPDYECVNVGFSASRNAVVMCIAHESFPSVALGCEAPYLVCNELEAIDLHDYGPKLNVLDYKVESVAGNAACVSINYAFEKFGFEDEKQADPPKKKSWEFLGAP